MRTNLPDPHRSQQARSAPPRGFRALALAAALVGCGAPVVVTGVTGDASRGDLGAFDAGVDDAPLVCAQNPASTPTSSRAAAWAAAGAPPPGAARARPERGDARRVHPRRALRPRQDRAGRDELRPAAVPLLRGLRGACVSRCVPMVADQGELLPRDVCDED